MSINQKAYRASCTHYRKGHVVHSTADDSVVFDGSQDLSDHLKKTGAKGINRAKAYVRKNGLKSYTV